MQKAKLKKLKKGLLTQSNEYKNRNNSKYIRITK